MANAPSTEQQLVCSGKRYEVFCKKVFLKTRGISFHLSFYQP